MRYFFLFMFILLQPHTFGAKSNNDTKNRDLLYFRSLKKNRPKSELLFALSTYYLNNSNASNTEINKRLENAYELSKDDVEKSYFLMAQILFNNDKNHPQKSYKKSLKLLKALKSNSFDHYTKTDAFLVLGSTSYSLKKPDQAIKYYNKSLSISKKHNNKEGMQKSFRNLSLCYIAKNDLTKARYYIKKAVFLISNGVNTNREETYLVQAFILLRQHKTALARECLITANNSSDKQYLKPYIEMQLMILCQIDNREDEMLLHFNKVLHYSSKYKNNNTAFGAFLHLKEYYEEKKDFEKAYIYKLKLDSINKIIDLDRQVEIVNDLSFKEKIKFLKLEKKRKDERLALEASNRKLLQLILCIVVAFLLIVVYLYRLQKKKNYILVKKNLESLKSFDTPEETSEDNNINKSDFIPSAELILKVEKLLTEKELFKDPEITVQKLAFKLNVSPIVLSKNINHHYKIPFRNLINNQRIELAKYMLVDSKYDHFSIEGIATSVGYTSKTTFYTNFKQITGVTPLFYRETAKKIIVGDYTTSGD